MAALPDKEKLIHNFHRCANWEERYLYIIELGATMPDLDDKYHHDRYRIAGCQSQVWIVMEPAADGKVLFQGDSDAALVKGLIALVFSLYQHMTAREIAEFDVRPWFEQLALTRHLTPSRSQGLEAMLRAIRQKVQSF